MRILCRMLPSLNAVNAGKRFVFQYLALSKRRYSFWRRFVTIQYYNENARRPWLHSQGLGKPNHRGLTTPQKDTAEALHVSAHSLVSQTPQEFAEFLRTRKIGRCYAVWDEAGRKVVASHPELQELADWMGEPSNEYYRQHEAVFLHLGVRTGCLMAAFIWKTNRGQACGGIRMKDFPSMEKFLVEGLRLSVRLGTKSALAGLWAGGGKGVIQEPTDKKHILPDFRQQLFYDYGDFVSSLNGCYIAGVDTGVLASDLYHVHSRTRWSVCMPEDVGGSGNAAKLMGRGVVCAMEAALDYLRMGDLAGKTVAIQGAGGVGTEVVSRLFDQQVAHVHVVDTNQKRVEDLYDNLASKASGKLTIEKVPLDDDNILGYCCDIFSPCATGHILNSKTIPRIKAKVICGAANAQMPREEDCALLEERGICYVFESIPNRMAIVNSFCEAIGRMEKDLVIEKHFNRSWEHAIYVLTQRVLREAEEKGITVVQAVNILTEQMIQQYHPLWPHRTHHIIRGLLESGWHLGNDFWRKRRNFAVWDGCA